MKMDSSTVVFIQMISTTQWVPTYFSIIYHRDTTKHFKIETRVLARVKTFSKETIHHRRQTIRTRDGSRSNFSVSEGQCWTKVHLKRLFQKQISLTSFEKASIREDLAICLKTSDHWTQVWIMLTLQKVRLVNLELVKKSRAQASRDSIRQP